MKNSTCDEPYETVYIYASCFFYGSVMQAFSANGDFTGDGTEAESERNKIVYYIPSQLSGGDFKGRFCCAAYPEIFFHPYSFLMIPQSGAKIVYVTGGARSGKSAFALHLAVPYNKRVFLATAEPFDPEMELRIGKHRAERGEQFTTIEEPLDLDRALRELPEGTEVLLLDCLTVWAGNLMHYAEERGEVDIEQQIERFLEVLRHPSCDIILVSNEVGMGIVPENAMARRFRDIAGIINQRVASLATEAWLLCSGMPLRLK